MLNNVLLVYSILQFLMDGELFSPLSFCAQTDHMLSVPWASDKIRFIKLQLPQNTSNFSYNSNQFNPLTLDRNPGFYYCCILLTSWVPIMACCQKLKCCSKNPTALHIKGASMGLLQPLSRRWQLLIQELWTLLILESNISEQADLINTTDLTNLSQTREYSYKKWFIVPFNLINCFQMQLMLCKLLSLCS